MQMIIPLTQPRVPYPTSIFATYHKQGQSCVTYWVGHMCMHTHLIELKGTNTIATPPSLSSYGRRRTVPVPDLGEDDVVAMGGKARRGMMNATLFLSVGLVVEVAATLWALWQGMSRSIPRARLREASSGSVLERLLAAGVSAKVYCRYAGIQLF